MTICGQGMLGALTTKARPIRLATALCVIFSAVLAVAEDPIGSLSYYSVKLPISASVAVGGDLLKIDLARESFLVSESKAPREVALRYLNNKELRDLLSNSDLKAIVLGATKGEDSEVIGAAYKAILNSGERPEFDSVDFWENIINSPQARELLVEALQSSDSQPVDQKFCAACLALGSENARVVNFKRLSNGGAAQCLEISLREALKDELAGNDSQPGASLVQAAEFFGAVDAQANKKLVEVINLATKIITELDQANDSSSQSDFSARLQELVSLADSLGIAGSSLILSERFVSHTLANGNFSQALNQIKEIPFSIRTPKTHASLSTVLRGLDPSNLSVIIDPDIREIVELYASKDQEIQAQWYELHKRMTQELLSRGDLSLAIQLLNACKNDNPELGKQLISSGANQIVKGYLDRGDVLSASKFVEENRGSIDFMTRLRLMAGRMNLSLMSFSLIVLISLGFGFWTVFRLFRRTDAAANDLEKYPEEYLEALATFGLSPKASVRNIKKAYRKAVKIHHPDLKQDSSREDQQFFIKLHMDYEALLKFHRQSK
jgi:hypothetical protein